VNRLAVVVWEADVKKGPYAGIFDFGAAIQLPLAVRNINTCGKVFTFGAAYPAE